MTNKIETSGQAERNEINKIVEKIERSNCGDVYKEILWLINRVKVLQHREHELFLVVARIWDETTSVIGGNDDQ